MPRIMIVDDDHITVRLLSTLLEIDGFDVSVAPTGREVVALAQQVRPDLILMDYHLEDIDGVQVVQRLRVLPAFQQTPIIVVSGMNVENEALAAGATRFLMKPFDPDSLQHLFNSLIHP